MTCRSHQKEDIFGKYKDKEYGINVEYDSDTEYDEDDDEDQHYFRTIAHRCLQDTFNEGV